MHARHGAKAYTCVDAFPLVAAVAMCVGRVARELLRSSARDTRTSRRMVNGVMLDPTPYLVA